MITNPDAILPIVTLEGDFDKLWDEVQDMAMTHLNDDGIKRLRAVMDHRVRTVAVERHYIDKDYRDTFSNYHSKRFSTPDSRCVRLHFFDKELDAAELVDPTTVQPHYLGYSVIRPTRPNAIGRTLVSADHDLLGGAQVCLTEEKVSLLGCDLTVKGFPFISQDADVTVCAQSALWMVCRYFSDRYTLYPETGPYQIGQLTNDYTLGRMYPSSGLTMWQMAEAFRLSGFHPVTYARSTYAGDFDHLLYTYIESGIPCLIGVPDHVIVAYGHQSDFTLTATPDADNLIASSAFNKTFIVSDDNKFPYQSLHRSGGVAPDSVYKFSQIDSFVVPLPEKVFLPAESVQEAALKVFKNYRAQSPTFSGNTLVMRTFLTTVRSFKRHLRDRGMGHADVEETYRNLPLPHFIWVCEFGLHGEYPDKIRGEIIWDATRNAKEPGGWIALHFPELLIVDQGSALNGPQKLITMDLQNSTDYPLFVSNLEAF